MLQFDSKTLDDLAARIGKAVEASPVKDVEKTVKAMLTSGLSRLDVVPRADFDTQAAVLAKTREKLEQLRALELGLSIFAAVVDTAPISVDTPADLEAARKACPR